MVSLPPEKLGSFYLGAKYDIKNKKITTETVNYDSRDLTTHAVCVGMTGSGKTGLCIGLLEEAAIDKVPAIIIDPKGDMTNLMLQFEDLDPKDFKNWINQDDASRKGMSVDEYADATAKKWKDGLASWGQDSSRIKDLKNAVDYTIYTPGSDAGIPVNIMGSFAAPGGNFDDDAEMLRERIQGTVAALLGMIDCKEDPVRSREGILLSNLFEHAWRNNQDLDLASIIRGIQKPPMQQLGVFDVDTFFPEKDRFQLAIDFNSLVASPQFAYWLQGDVLDIEQIYFTTDGKPRHSIFYIAHLSESERMFFVTLLLNSVITWMRRQSGTSSLRSLVYFDEIFGYFPPTAQPPSKKPLLTILKQARAFGVGAVLVTQNPVDIDYKGLSNAGTWFIGKLQTERDKDRVLDGLKGAIAEAGSASGNMDFSNIISSLGSRVFLMHNVHESEPVVYHTRWAMSYLRGPLTRPQLKDLMAQKKKQNSNNNGKSVASSSARQEKTESIVSSATPPSVDPSIDQRYFSIWKSAKEASNGEASSDSKLVYIPQVLASAKVRFHDSKSGIDEVKDFSYLAPPPDEFGRIDWDSAEELSDWENSLESEPDHSDETKVEFSNVPDTLNSSKEVTKVQKEYANYLYQKKRKNCLEHKDLKLSMKPGESDEAFYARLQQSARELRDEELDKIQEKYEVKLDRIEDKILKEERQLEAAKEDKKARKTAELVGMAETVFSVFVKKRSRSISSVTSKSRMRRKAVLKVEESEEELEELELDFREMEDELKEKLDEIKNKWNNVEDGLTTKQIKPRKTDVQVSSVLLVWHPYWQGNNGQRYSAKK